MRVSHSIRLSLALLLGGVVLLFAAPAATAQDYPGGPTLTVDRPSVVCGDTVVITGKDFLPNTEVTLTVGGEVIGTVMTDGQGNFSFRWTVPCSLSGSVTVTATDDVNTLSVSITVSAPGPSPTAAPSPTPSGTGTLPRTGSDNDGLVRAGLLLVAVGGLLVLATRKRDRAAADA
jgi:LPXTG-motif cell wall-anchored protein